MSEQRSDAPPEEPSIVWWPWWVLAAGPILAAVLATLRNDPADGSGGFLGFMTVALLALLFLGAIFAPSLLLISRNMPASRSARERAAFVFVACVAGAHLVGQLIERAGPDSGESIVWALAFIGTYIAASALSWLAMRRTYAEPTDP